jgi:hypothetical protein
MHPAFEQFRPLVIPRSNIPPPHLATSPVLTLRDGHLQVILDTLPSLWDSYLLGEELLHPTLVSSPFGICFNERIIDRQHVEHTVVYNASLVFFHSYPNPPSIRNGDTYITFIQRPTTFFFSTIYNTGLARSPQAAHTNTEYSTTTLCSAHYVLPKPRSLLLAGNHKHKAHGLFQDNVTLSSSKCRHEPAGCGNHHVYPRIALGKVPRLEPTTEGGAVTGRH